MIFLMTPEEQEDWDKLNVYMTERTFYTGKYTALRGTAKSHVVASVVSVLALTLIFTLCNLFGVKVSFSMVVGVAGFCAGTFLGVNATEKLARQEMIAAEERCKNFLHSVIYKYRDRENGGFLKNMAREVNLPN